MKQAINAIIFSENKDQVLLIERRDLPIWVLPGGGVDEGEKPEKAVVREFLEETGLSVKIKRKVSLYTPINRLGTTTHIYECTKISGEPTTGPETFDIGYYPINDLPKNFFHIHRDMLQDALEKSAQLITKPLDKVTYISLLKYFIKHPIRIIRFLLSKMDITIN